ncbi:MAG TPA: hypothetical protein VMW22_08510, partial [Candidatus Desulfaltia sp.]|nr:hypothetical protein [Candidatus Desulfaltia sp.]
EAVTWSVGMDKVKEVQQYGDALVTACPFCYLTFERCQLMQENNPNLPVLHIPQLLGLAMGIDADEVGLSHNKVGAKAVAERLEG